MLPGDLYRIQAASARIQTRKEGEGFWAICSALELYRYARYRAIRKKVCSALTGRPRALLDLDEVRAHAALRACFQDRAQSVAISRIQGSEGRCHDFDVEFWPLRSHCRERWVRIAAARLLRTPLPPITLTQVGDRYFVLDGHHRLSVARALGQIEIDAEVTVCEFAGPLPWEQAATARKPALARTAAHG